MVQQDPSFSSRCHGLPGCRLFIDRSQFSRQCRIDGPLAVGLMFTIGGLRAVLLNASGSNGMAETINFGCLEIILAPKATTSS